MMGGWLKLFLLSVWVESKQDPHDGYEYGEHQ